MSTLRALILLFALTMICGCAATDSPTTATDRIDVPEGTRVEVVRIASRGVNVPATFVVPPSAQSERLPLVILVHGHGGSREEAGGFARVATALAANGIASIRMDFAGCGDSTEPFTNNNLTTMLADIHAAEQHALRWAPIDLSRRALVGYSMGGRLSVTHAAANPGYKTMVLWAPSLLNGPDRLLAMMGGEARYRDMKQRALRDGFVDFTTSWGQKQQLGSQWFIDLETSTPLDAIKSFDGSLMLIHGSDDDVVLPEVSTMALNAALAADIAELSIIDGADHGFGLFSDEPELAQQLTDKTISFLISTL